MDSIGKASKRQRLKLTPSWGLNNWRFGIAIEQIWESMGLSIAHIKGEMSDIQWRSYVGRDIPTTEKHVRWLRSLNFGFHQIEAIV